MRVRCGLMAAMAMLVLLSACSRYEFKRNTYNALHDYQCIAQSGEPHCDPDRPSYDDYRRQAKEASEKD